MYSNYRNVSFGRLQAEVRVILAISIIVGVCSRLAFAADSPLSNHSLPAAAGSSPSGAPSATTASSLVGGLTSNSTSGSLLGTNQTSATNETQAQIRLYNQTGRLHQSDPIEAAASFIETTALSEKQQQPRAKSNRWTHFGARLRPLATGSKLRQTDQHQTAATASEPATMLHRPPTNSLDARGRSPEDPASSGGGATSDDDDDDELDSEAILYKMMQQQGFLLDSNWGSQQLGPVIHSSLDPNQNQGSNANLNSIQNSRQPSVNRNGNGIGSTSGNSKKVIKLLKSYSHIHQVDDSDDQIRGTYTRVASRRPSGASQSSQALNYNRNRSPNVASSIGKAEHIYVSSRPVSRLEASGSGHFRTGQATNENDNYNKQQPPALNDDGQAEEDFECPNNGIFADVSSGCQSYHVCQSGAQVQQKFQCPLGTLFNDIILTCDFAHNVQCSGRQGQPSQPSQQPQHSVLVQSTPLPSPASQSQASGPRQLTIGRHTNQVGQFSGPAQQRSQYSHHQQRHQDSRIQAVGSYPAPRPIESSDTDESEGERDEPLVPATLPPRAYTQPLPYNPPPRPLQPAQPAGRRGPPANYVASVEAPFDGAGASASTPVLSQPTGPETSQPNSLDLVINHVARPPPPTPIKPAPTPQRQQHKQQQQQQQQHQPQVPAYSSPPANPPRASGGWSRPKASASQAAPQALQSIQVAKSAGGVIDLTGAQSPTGAVSSDALNDGLLLIVRHSSGSSPLHLAGPQRAAAPGSGGQAYAVAPSLVRPDSAVDSQLFPHVQQALASRPAIVHQAPPQSTQQQQQQSSVQAARAATNQANGQTLPSVRPPLPPMEPPKPTGSHQKPETSQSVEKIPSKLKQSTQIKGNASKQTKRLKPAAQPKSSQTTTQLISSSSSSTIRP